MRHEVIIPDWIEFDGTACPVDPYSEVKLQFVDEDRFQAERYPPARASDYDWAIKTGPRRIIAYRPVRGTITVIEAEPRPLFQIAAPRCFGTDSFGVRLTISLPIALAFGFLIALAVMA